MNQIQQILVRAEQQCLDQGARLTNKRKQILVLLLESEKALSAYELIDICKQKTGDSLSPMSVYRVLDFLQSENLAHKLHSANKFIACSHITCDHSHNVPQFLICGNCQKVSEVGFNQAIISQIQHQVQDTGFQLVSPQIELDCLCNDCRAKSPIKAKLQ